jgi:hypothetical protein
MRYRAFVDGVESEYLERSPCDPSFAEAERELLIVHAIECARLLREASNLHCMAGDDGGRAALRAHARWKLACREELDCARRDGRGPHPLLLRCLMRPIARWPRAVELALAAQELDACDAGRLQLARAERAEGDPRRAIARLEELLADAPERELRAEVLHALALARSAAGEEQQALRELELAADTGRSALEPLVALLALALRTADRRRVEAASERLARIDLRVAGVERRFRRATRRLRARLLREEQQLPRSDATCRLARELAVHRPGAAAEVARCLF